MKILGTGLSGLVGSRIRELLLHKYEFEEISLESGTDITKRDEVIRIIEKSNSDVVLHLAAKADVDGCEMDRERGEEGDAWKINVIGTQNVVDVCQDTGKKIIYVSTDFVFDGENCPEDGYSEEDSPNPINWYAKTKYEGEKIVQKLDSDWIITRLAYPYRSTFPRKDFARAILSILEQGKKVSAVEDHIITPTFIDDIANVLDVLIQTNAKGVFHVVGSQFVSPYEAAMLIAKELGFSQSLIQKTTRAKYFKNRAKRPFCLKLKNDKIQKLGVKMRTFEEGLGEVKYQLNSLSS